MTQPDSPSSRSFGYIFAGVFFLIGLWPWLVHGLNPRYWSIGLGLVFLLTAFIAPQALSPFKNIWLRFGSILHHVTNPIVMGFIYFGAFVPMGIIVKLTNKDPLRLKRQPAIESYWVSRDRPSPSAESMSKQF